IDPEDGSSSVAAATVGPRFYNTTPPEWVARAIAQLRPEPKSIFGAKLALTPERFGAVPRAYIECVQDQALPPATQRALQPPLPRPPVLSLDTDHSPFYSAPAALAACLEDVAERVPRR